MQPLKNWRLGQGPTSELLRYCPEQDPPPEDVDQFVRSARAQQRLLPLQTSRYVLRETRQSLAWLTSYIACEMEDLRANFISDEKSFYIVLLEHSATGDRSVAFRLTTAGVGGYTQWRVSLRRVRFEGDEEYFLCAEY